MKTAKNTERADRHKRQVALESLPEAEISEVRPSRLPGLSTYDQSVLYLATPMAISMLADTLMGLVDTTLVARLGKEALGGVGVSTMFMFLFYSFATGTLRGVKVQTAHAVGRGEGFGAGRYAHAGFWFALVYGVFVFLIGRHPAPLFRAVGVSSDVVPYAAAFFSAVTWGAPGTALLAVATQFSQGLGDSRSPMKIQLAANLLNAVLAWFLIRGGFGLPAMGVAGAGYATAFSVTVNALVQTWQIRKALLSARFTRAALREVLTVGLPTGLQFVVEMLAMTTFTALLGGISSDEVAANQLALMILRTSFLPGVAIGEAASVLVGQALGARDHGAARSSVKSALKIALLYMAFCAVGFAFLGGALSRLFCSDEHVARISQKLLWIGVAFQIPDAVNIVYRGALRGAKDVKVPARIAIISVWLFVPTAAYVLGQRAGLGAVGGWIGFLCETLFASFWYIRRWRSGRWLSTSLYEELRPRQ